MQRRRKNIVPNLLLRAATVALCGVLLCAVQALLPVRAGAAKAAPAGCTLEEGRPKLKTAFPLAAAQWRCSDGYGWRQDPLDEKNEEFHRGADLACAEGTPVLAAMDGVVVSARRSASYGNVLRVCHAGGWETLYAHLQYLYVRAGEVVHAGQPLGTVGQTGRVTGAHLHFELREKGTACDPSALLGL